MEPSGSLQVRLQSIQPVSFLLTEWRLPTAAVHTEERCKPANLAKLRASKVPRPDWNQVVLIDLASRDVTVIEVLVTEDLLLVPAFGNKLSARIECAVVLAVSEFGGFRELLRDLGKYRSPRCAVPKHVVAKIGVHELRKLFDRHNPTRWIQRGFVELLDDSEILALQEPPSPN